MCFRLNNSAAPSTERGVQEVNNKKVEQKKEVSGHPEHKKERESIQK